MDQGKHDATLSKDHALYTGPYRFWVLVGHVGRIARETARQGLQVTESRIWDDPQRPTSMA